MKTISLIICTFCLFLLYCSAHAGETTLQNIVPFEYGDIHYESPVTEELAIRVGEMLEGLGGEGGGVFNIIQMYRFDGRSRAQLTQVGDKYVVKFALLPGLDKDERTFQMFRITWALLGGLGPLGDHEKEVHLCDPAFNTLRIIPQQ